MNEAPTKEKILTAAQKLFVEHGFAGTSMGKIGKLAGVNHSLLFHHFGNKEQLWVAVKQNIARTADQKSKVLPSTDLPLKIFLKRLITQGIDFYLKHPDIIRMINWQRLEANDKVKIGITHSTEVEDWLKAIRHYQKKGEITRTLKPKFILTLITSIISSAALDQNLFIQKPKDLQQYIDFCVNPLEQGLKS